jgi:transposase-like protein
MKRRKLDSRFKAQVVVQGLQGKPVSELCNEHQISQTQYYKWRDQFLSNAGKVFDSPRQSLKEERLKQENERLKSLIGELTLELKKSEEVFG